MKNFIRTRNTIHPGRIDWILLYGVLGLLFVSYMYVDILLITRIGMNVWETIENGQFFDFYSYRHSEHDLPRYDFPIYIIFSLWNFPLYILERFFNMDVFSSFGCLLYLKLILLPFLFGSAHVLRRICEELNLTAGQAKVSVFLFLSSGFVMSSIFVLAQVDIIMIFFLLLGLLMYIKNNMKLFLLFFAITVSFKLFSLMVFVPLLLLKHKKILPIIGYLLCSLSILVLFKLPFAFSRGETELHIHTRLIIDVVESSNLTLGYGTNILLAAFVVLWAFCYVKTIDTEDELRKYAVYIPYLSFSLFFIFTSPFPYWYVMLTPFLPIIIYQNSKYMKLSLILDAIAAASMIISQQIIYYWCFNSTRLRDMLLPKIFGSLDDMNKRMNITGVYKSLLGEYYDSAPVFLNTLFVACMAVILFLNFPRRDKVPEAYADSPMETPRSIVRFRLLTGAGVCLLPIAVYLASIAVYGLK